MMTIASREMRVLIAEDDYLVCEEIARAVESIGHTVAGKAPDGPRAVEMAEALRPDAVLLDIDMPGCDGLEVARRLTRACPIPMVILSAFDNPELLAQATDTGIGAYLVKPPDAGQIERALAVASARFSDLAECRRLYGELDRRNRSLDRMNERLRGALAEIDTLRGIIPICSYCKKVRNDEGYWQQVDVYVRQHSAAEFSHGICPDCQERLRCQMCDDDSPADS